MHLGISIIFINDCLLKTQEVNVNNDSIYSDM